MSGGILTMNGKERERGCLVRQAVRGELGQRECAERLGIGVRQFKRLVRAWRNEGDTGLVSRQRGQPSHRRLNEATRERIEALCERNTRISVPPWQRRSFWSWTASGSRLRWCGAADPDRPGSVAAEDPQGATGVPVTPAASTVWRTDPDRSTICSDDPYHRLIPYRQPTGASPA
jgi:transposase